MLAPSSQRSHPVCIHNIRLHSGERLIIIARFRDRAAVSLTGTRQISPQEGLHLCHGLPPPLRFTAFRPIGEELLLIAPDAPMLAESAPAFL